MTTLLRSLFLVASFALSVTWLGAQNDAKAKADLEALRKHYDKGGSLEADVTLEIEFPEQPVEVQKGHILQQGEQFRVEFAGQHVISDGVTVWMFLPDNMEVQVYNASEGTGLEGGGFMRPQDILNIYESDGFEYAITDELTEGGVAIREITFKPTDKLNEFAKIRLRYDPVAKEVHSIKVFNKDGSRFALALSEVKTGGAFEQSRFRFDAAAYPDVSIEDMRL